MSEICKQHCDSMARDKNGIIDCRKCQSKVREACHAYVRLSVEAHKEHLAKVEKAILESSD